MKKNKSENYEESIDSLGQKTFTKVKIKSIYNREEKQPEINFGPSLTQQQFTQETLIQTIMKKHAATGILGTGQPGTQKAQWGDYSDMDFREMSTKIAKSTETFDALPSHLRDKFNNNVGELLDFMENEENKEEAIELGIIPPIEKPLKAHIEPTDPPKPSEAPKGDPKPSDA